MQIRSEGLSGTRYTSIPLQVPPQYSSLHLHLSYASESNTASASRCRFVTMHSHLASRLGPAASATGERPLRPIDERRVAGDGHAAPVAFPHTARLDADRL